MKKLLLVVVCVLPFFVGGLFIDFIAGTSLGFFHLLAIFATVWFSICLSNMIFLGFTKTNQQIQADLKEKR